MIQSVERTEINKLEDIDPDFLLKYETCLLVINFPPAAVISEKNFIKSHQNISIIKMN